MRQKALQNSECETAMDWPSLTTPMMDALAVLLVFGLTMALIRIGLLQYSLIAPPDAEAVPVLHMLAVAGGVALGVLLLAALPHAGDFLPSRIYAADSPWDIGVLEFIRGHALPRRNTLAAAWHILRQGDPVWPAMGGYIGLGLTGLAVLQALLTWRGGQALRAALAALLLAGWTALVMHHLAHLAAWTATMLNFWLFALLLLFWQRRRYGQPSLPH
jgi:hypothetical protein